MRICSVALLLILSVSSALGGANPNVFAYVDFDPPNNVHRVDPELYDIVHGYLMLDCLAGGFYNISLAVYVTPEMSLNTGYEGLLPNLIVLGDFEEGIILSTYGDTCLVGSPYALAVARIVYSGTPGDVMLVDHPDWPRWVVDCQQPTPEVDYYCLLSNGGVGKDPIPTGEMCGCPTPVEDESWGTIKAMFR